MNKESKTNQRVKDKSTNQSQIKESYVMKEKLSLPTPAKKIKNVQIEIFCWNDTVTNQSQIKESNVMKEKLSLPTTAKKIKKISNWNILLKRRSKLPSQFVNEKIRRCIVKYKQWDKRWVNLNHNLK